MKKLLFIGLTFLAFGIMSMTLENNESENELTHAPKAGQTYVKIKMRNNCDHEIKYEYNGTHGTLSKNYYREFTIKPGYMLIIDGQDFKKITAEDDRQDVIVCQ
ncbi:MAG: hypothetical protein QNK23_11275 [Crocinitomicaceae bacterium]|nr:hypothetical protein [Crocinitomicaceae bacterium]